MPFGFRWKTFHVIRLADWSRLSAAASCLHNAISLPYLPPSHLGISSRLVGMQNFIYLQNCLFKKKGRKETADDLQEISEIYWKWNFTQTFSFFFKNVLFCLRKQKQNNQDDKLLNKTKKIIIFTLGMTIKYKIQTHYIVGKNNRT